MLTEIRENSIWKARQDFKIGIGSDIKNPNSKSLLIKKGTLLKWDGDSDSGNVWFIFEIDDLRYRGKTESGCILNLIKRELIELVDNGNGFKIYGINYITKYLNN